MDIIAFLGERGCAQQRDIIYGTYVITSKLGVLFIQWECNISITLTDTLTVMGINRKTWNSAQVPTPFMPGQSLFRD